MAGRGDRVLVGPDSGDDAGVYRLGDEALVATADFIPPVCDDPFRFGRVAATNSLSDVWAMGGTPLFALNLCLFPSSLPDGVAAAILSGAARALADAGAVLLGGHSVSDKETKFGLAVVGRADPTRLLTLGGARPGQALVLTKPLGTGVLINAFKADRIDEAGLEPALAEMERANAEASHLALERGATCATDVTGFGLLGHAANLARESDVTLEIDYAALPAHPGFHDLVRAGVSTGCTPGNREYASLRLEWRRELDPAEEELLFDPQTSGGLLVALPDEAATGLVDGLLASGHRAAIVGRVGEGPARLVVR